MKIRILSALHREFGPTEIPQCEADLIILAGDIAIKQNALPWIKEFCGATPTAYVCGNHEFYGDKIPRVTERLIEATQGTNLHVLEDTFFEWKGGSSMDANPQAYPGEENPNFVRNMILELPN